MDVLQGHILTHGPQCREFEEEFAAFLGDECYCVTVSSCMAALHLAYLHLGIGPGDEVIVPAQTHTATVHAVELVGARPVFVDCEAGTGNIDTRKLEPLVTQRTRALSLVHFLGIPCGMDEVMAFADRHHLKVVEDCALAVGSRYRGKHVGLFGDAGCFSFYPVKHMTTAEGGMFVSRHEEITQSVAKLRAFGVDRSHAERNTPGKYDVVMLGLNYRMSELQAALGRQQLANIPENLARRQDNFAQLKGLISQSDGLRVIDSDGNGSASSHYCLSVLLEGSRRGCRDEMISKLNQAGVGTSIYYPQPVPRLTYYEEKYGYDPQLYPNAVSISDCSIALPVGPHITHEDIGYIGEVVSNTLKETM